MIQRTAKMSKQSEKPFLDFNLLKRIIQLTGPYRLVFYLSIFMSVSLAVISIGRPMIIIYVSNHFISAAHFDLKKLEYATLWMVILLVAESIVRYLFNYT